MKERRERWGHQPDEEPEKEKDRRNDRNRPRNRYRVVIEGAGIFGDETTDYCDNMGEAIKAAIDWEAESVKKEDGFWIESMQMETSRPGQKQEVSEMPLTDILEERWGDEYPKIWRRTVYHKLASSEEEEEE